MIRMKRTYRVDEVADELSVSRRTIERMITRGELQAFKIGRLTRVNYHEIDLLSQKISRPNASERDKP